MSKLVYILEDDAFLARTLKETLADLGVDCKTFPSVHEFESVFPGDEPDHLLVDLAVPLGGSNLIDAESARAGHQAGIALLRLVRGSWENCAFSLITGGPSADAKDWCDDNGIEYILKPIGRTTLERVLGLRQLRAFVVHGRDLGAVQKVKDVLGRVAIESTVLMERPNRGRTVIEKFEDIAALCDYAVVLLSPDDLGSLASGSGTTQARARQNVIFELGFFCGLLGRESGRVVIVEFGDCEIPSDLAGVVRLDGQKSVDELVDELSREFENQAPAR